MKAGDKKHGRVFIVFDIVLIMKGLVPVAGGVGVCGTRHIACTATQENIEHAVEEKRVASTASNTKIIPAKFAN